jgi:hypothetical protein
VEAHPCQGCPAEICLAGGIIGILDRVIGTDTCDAQIDHGDTYPSHQVMKVSPVPSTGLLEACTQDHRYFHGTSKHSCGSASQRSVKYM